MRVFCRAIRCDTTEGLLLQLVVAATLSWPAGISRISFGPYFSAIGSIMAGTSKTPDATDHAVGKKIRSQRILLGLSQTELGDKLGITFQQIQKYERGANRISVGRLKRIADIFDVPIYFFFDGATGKGPLVENINAGLSFLETAASVRLVRAFAEIKGQHIRTSIVDLVEGIASSQSSRRK